MSNLASRLSQLSPAERALLEQRLAARAAQPASPPIDAIPRRPAGQPIALSFSQRRVWYLEQLTPGTPTYNAPYAFRGRGPLDQPAFRRAVNALLERHAVLRTNISTSAAGEPVCSVANDWDAVRIRTAATEADALRLLEEAAQTPFDISRDLLLRADVVTLGPDDFLLLFTAHHIAWDGVSKGIFFQQLGELYALLVEARQPPPTRPSIDYADYADWQASRFSGAMEEREIAYWKRQLGDAPAYLDLPLDRPRPAMQRFQGAKVAFTLRPGILARAQALSRDSRVTLYITMLASFKVFLLAMTAQADLSVATPFAGRDEPQTEHVIGFFTNTVVLRTRLAPQETFRSAIQKVRTTVLEAQEHQTMPMDRLVDVLGRPRDLNRMPLAQVNFRLQGGKPPEPQLAGVVLTPLPMIDTLISKFDMALEVASVEGEAGYLEYNTDLFSATRMNALPAAYEALLQSLLDQPDAPVAELPAFQQVRALNPTRRRLGMAGTNSLRGVSHG